MLARSCFNIKATKKTICTSSKELTINSFNTWNVLFMTNTNRLNIKSLRKMAYKHFLITITWCNGFTNIYLNNNILQRDTSPVITVAQWPTKKVLFEHVGRLNAIISPTLSPIIKNSVLLYIRVTIAEHFFSSFLQLTINIKPYIELHKSPVSTLYTSRVLRKVVRTINWLSEENKPIRISDAHSIVRTLFEQLLSQIPTKPLLNIRYKAFVFV